MFDRLGAGHLMTVGYRGTRDLVFTLANLVIADREDNHQPTPDTWLDPWLPTSDAENAVVAPLH
jgi:nitrogenase molybdenum-iron protein NifN